MQQVSPQDLYILGHPVAHSKSPAMYNAVYEHLGLPWTYGFMDVAAEEAAKAFLEERNFLAVNVTTPYKPVAFCAATIKAASASLAQGVNLLVNKGDQLLGYNVDGEGCVAFLEREGVVFEGARVVVCGTGPTALAILHSCAQVGAREVLMLGRFKERSQKVMNRYLEEYRHLASTAITFTASGAHRGFVDAYEHTAFKYGSYETSTKAIRAADIIIDATVLGMKTSDPAPFDISLLTAGQTVMDVVYGHGETALIGGACKAGCKTYDGSGMLVAQAVKTVIMLTEIEGLDMNLDFNDLFALMAEAAGFNF